MNRHLDTVVVCPLMTKLHLRWRSPIEAPCAGRQAAIAVDQIRKISELRLGRRIDALDTSTASRLRRLITEMNGE
jgi:mRNA interferase MazF